MRMNRGHDYYNEKKSSWLLNKFSLSEHQEMHREKNGEYAYMLMLECKELKQTIPNACV